jgi:outer membrane protein assembly factor BamB
MPDSMTPKGKSMPRSKASIRAAGSVLLTAAVLTGGATAQDWTQWRGPARDGVVPNFKSPRTWPESLKQVWKVEVGLGHSTPLASADRLYVFARIGSRETVRCLQLADGAEVWKQDYEAPYEMDPAAVEHGPGPKSTPLLAGGRLYTLGISGILTCWGAARGQRLWRQDLAATFPKSAPQFGTAMSPLLYKGLLIADLGGREGGVLAAFDAATGKVRWRWKHEDGPGYASPIIVELAGTTQLVTQTCTACVGINADNGKLLWSYPFTSDYEQNSVSPVEWGKTLIFGGYQKPTFAVRLAGQGSKLSAEEVWDNAQFPMYMSTPVLLDSRLYGMSQRNSGQLFALDAATGKTLWAGSGRLGDNAALVVADGLLLALTTGSELLVHRAGDDGALAELARYRGADSPTWAHPVLLSNRIVIKDADSLICWSLGE